MEKIGLYIHIPFCKSKCYYCDFTTMPYQEKRIMEYFELLKDEILLYKNISNDYLIDTIYLGGGTPSYVNSKYIKDLNLLIKKTFNLCENLEYTIETNPETITVEKLNDYKLIGINRISLGVQTFNNKILNNIGRNHKKEDILNSYRLLRDNKFKNISMDLIMGLPGQTIKDIDYDLSMIKELSPEHLSYYDLIIEKNTRLNYLLKNKKIFTPTEEENRFFYHKIIKELQKINLYQYELSNFSKKNFMSQHNLKYWNVEKYLGIGIGASGYLYNTRYTNATKYLDYKNLITNEKKPVIFSEQLTNEDKIFEKIIMNMRLNKGLSIDELKENYNYNIFEKNKELIENFIELNLLILEDGYLKFSENGFNISNKFFVDIII